MIQLTERIIESVNEENLLVIIKTFEIKSWVSEFHFFQGSWQPKLGETLNASNEDKQSSLVHYSYAFACKDTNRKTVAHVPKYVSKQVIFFIKCGGKKWFLILAECALFFLIWGCTKF